MKTKILLLLFLFLGLSVYQVNAQKNNKKIFITGTVQDSTGRPIVNAIILIDGTKTDVFTDYKGNYRIKVSPTASRIGVFTFGHGISEEDISGRTQVDFNFGVRSAAKADKSNTGEDAVNSGYANIKNKNLTTTVSKVNADRKNRTYTSIYDMLSQVPGVSVRGTSINIRDSKDFLGDVPPLIVVDNVPINDVGGIDPNTVKSVEVLKGSAAAIYGSRGYGGVILITTKSFQKK